MEKTETTKRVVRELIEQAETLAAEYGKDVEAAVKAAVVEPLDEVRARKLYTRLISILRAAEGVDVENDAAVAEQIRNEVDEVIASVERPHTNGRRVKSEPLQLV